VPCSFSTGLQYKGKGLGAAPNATRRAYVINRRQRDILGNLGAGLSLTDIARAACGVDDITDDGCVDVLLLALTPAAYSSNSTADTRGHAFISPAQVRETSHCVHCIWMVSMLDKQSRCAWPCKATAPGPSIKLNRPDTADSLLCVTMQCIHTKV
jgi:hypothetical protein